MLWSVGGGMGGIEGTLLDRLFEIVGTFPTELHTHFHFRSTLGTSESRLRPAIRTEVLIGFIIEPTPMALHSAFRQD